MDTTKQDERDTINRLRYDIASAKREAEKARAAGDVTEAATWDAEAKWLQAQIGD